VETNELFYAKGVLLRLAQAAREDRAQMIEIRDLVMQSGILHIFAEGPGLDVFSVLDEGGEGLLRARLAQLSLADLRKIVQTNDFDSDAATPRWRSPARFIELIVTRALALHEERQRAQLEQQYAIALAAAAAVAGPQPAPSETESAETPKAAAWML
jgi:hypothetical protein